MYFMGLSATRFFKHWPDLAAEYDQISLHNCWIETFKHDGTQMVPPLLVSRRLRDEGLDPDTPPGTFQMRPLVYRMYIRQVEKLGVDIQFGKKVVDYFEDEERGRAWVVTDKGETFEADVVIAADGVASKSQRLVGGQVRAMKSGRAMWRAAFPIQYLDKDPEVKRFFRMMKGKTGPEPIIRTWLGYVVVLPAAAYSVEFLLTHLTDSPGAYALTLTREDTIIWIMNHDVSPYLPEIKTVAEHLH
jgi:2-polyprenyl-6-methoxyphenol hydroxylase-like FAD-dependent oxidoreductase